MNNNPFMIFTIVIINLLVIIILIQIFAFIFRNKVLIRSDKQSNFSGHKEPIEQIDIFINNIAISLAKLSYDKIGGIIIIENKNNLNKYINLGIKIDADFSPEFVVNVFYNHKSPLHDGAMIIRNFKICSLSCYLPLTKKILSVEYGARHRAAFGICEQFDCLAFVVSETSGNITFSYKNIQKRLSNNVIKLTSELNEIFKRYWLHENLIKKD